MSKTSYNLNLIKAVVFDIDGVLSPSTVPMDANGVPMRMANIKACTAIDSLDSLDTNADLYIIASSDS
ncbi:MAG: hypothetical protein K2P06_02370, partial [Muribaculaceae bacterium]|nr:hypothetical protein [Muribaculaceae bacterium]